MEGEKGFKGQKGQPKKMWGRGKEVKYRIIDFIKSAWREVENDERTSYI
jgi:hypothetical protein